MWCNLATRNALTIRKDHKGHEEMRTEISFAQRLVMPLQTRRMRIGIVMPCANLSEIRSSVFVSFVIFTYCEINPLLFASLREIFCLPVLRNSRKVVLSKHHKARHAGRCLGSTRPPVEFLGLISWTNVPVMPRYYFDESGTNFSSRLLPLCVLGRRG
jgi:hypothetical protein